MLRITSFSFAGGFPRRSWEFREDMVVFRLRSLTADFTEQIQYERIKVIQGKTVRDLRGLWWGFLLTGGLGFVQLIVSFWGHEPPVLDLLRRIGAVCALALLLPVLVKKEIYLFYDVDREPLFWLPFNEKNAPLVFKAIELIRNKAQIISETHPDEYQPDEAAAILEITKLDVPDFFNRCRTTFYEDKFVDVEETLLEEIVSELHYSELSGKINMSRMGNTKWNDLAWIWTFLVSIILVFLAMFFPKIAAQKPIIYAFAAQLAVIIVMFFMRFVKRDLVSFYNHNGKVIYWTWLTPAHREKWEQGIQLIKSKIKSPSI